MYCCLFVLVQVLHQSAQSAVSVGLHACNQIFTALLIFLSNSSYLHEKYSLCTKNVWVHASKT